MAHCAYMLKLPIELQMPAEHIGTCVLGADYWTCVLEQTSEFDITFVVGAVWAFLRESDFHKHTQTTSRWRRKFGEQKSIHTLNTARPSLRSVMNATCFRGDRLLANYWLHGKSQEALDFRSHIDTWESQKIFLYLADFVRRIRFRAV